MSLITKIDSLYIQGKIALTELATKATSATSAADSFFSQAETKMSAIESVMKQFVTFVQTYVAIPAVIVLIACGLVVAFGGQKGSEIAKTWAFRLICGVGIVMCVLTLTSMIMNLFISDDVASFSVKSIRN